MSERVTIDRTGGLGPITLEMPPGRAAVSPASRIAVEAIGTHRDLLRGVGIDWGTGTGALAIAAARIPAVARVVGLELDAHDLGCAMRNAGANGVAEKVTFVHADSFAPLDVREAGRLDDLVAATDFLVANPPASTGDDGLGWRREVLRGGARFLRAGAPAALQISFQYGETRIRRLCSDVPEYRYDGVLLSSPWVPFVESREDLPALLPQYAAEEARGGLPYTFPGPDAPGTGVLDARTIYDRYRATGMSPLTRWQVHLFRRT